MNADELPVVVEGAGATSNSSKSVGRSLVGPGSVESLTLRSLHDLEAQTVVAGQVALGLHV